jgi:hypothetical protein
MGPGHFKGLQCLGTTPGNATHTYFPTTTLCLKCSYKLLVTAQEVRWNKGGTEPGFTHFSMEMGMLMVTYGQAFSYMRASLSQLTGWTDYVGDRMSHNKNNNNRQLM